MSSDYFGVARTEGKIPFVDVSPIINSTLVPLQGVFGEKEGIPPAFSTSMWFFSCAEKRNRVLKVKFLG